MQNFNIYGFATLGKKNGVFILSLKGQEDKPLTRELAKAFLQIRANLNKEEGVDIDKLLDSIVE